MVIWPGSPRAPAASGEGGEEDAQYVYAPDAAEGQADGASFALSKVRKLSS